MCIRLPSQMEILSLRTAVVYHKKSILIGLLKGIGGSVVAGPRVPSFGFLRSKSIAPTVYAVRISQPGIRLSGCKIECCSDDGPWYGGVLCYMLTMKVGLCLRVQLLSFSILHLSSIIHHTISTIIHSTFSIFHSSTHTNPNPENILYILGC